MCSTTRYICAFFLELPNEKVSHEIIKLIMIKHHYLRDTRATRFKPRKDLSRLRKNCRKFVFNLLKYIFFWQYYFFFLCTENFFSVCSFREISILSAFFSRNFRLSDLSRVTREDYDRSKRNCSLAPTKRN